MINASTFGVLPQVITFKAEQVKGKNGPRYRFVYTEAFTDRKLAERTADVMRHAAAAAKSIGIFITHRLTRKGGVFTVKGTVSSERIGDMMVGEFLGWSTLGNMKLRDIILSYAVGGAGGVSAGGRRRGLHEAGPSEKELRRMAAMPPAFPPGFDAEFAEVGSGVGVGDLRQIGADKVPEKFLAQKPEARRKP